MDILLGDKIVYSLNILDSGTRIKEIINKLEDTNATTNIYTFKSKISMIEPKDSTMQDLINIIPLYENVGVSIDNVNEYFIEISITGKISNIMGFIDSSDIRSLFRELSKCLSIESNLLNSLRNERDIRIHYDESCILRFLKDKNKASSMVYIVQYLTHMSQSVIYNLMKQITDYIYKMTPDEIMQYEKDEPYSLSLNSIDEETILSVVSRLGW